MAIKVGVVTGVDEVVGQRFIHIFILDASDAKAM